MPRSTAARDNGSKCLGRFASAVPAYVRAALRGNFTARARFETANVDFDRVEGRLIDFMAAVDWEPQPWLGLSLGYTIHHVRLEALERSFVGTTRQRYSGPFAGLRSSF
jgi:hypothetical protein